MPKLFDLLSDESSRKRLADMGDHAPRRGHPSAGSRRRPNPARAAALSLPAFVAVDFETTGLDARADRVIELGAVKFVNGREIELLTTLTNPGRPIPPEVTALTGITDLDVARAPRFEDELAKLVAFVGELPVCGHQVEFDLSFLAAEMKRQGHDRLPNLQIDTASLARLAMPEQSGYTLTQVSASLGVALPRAHRALEDARAAGLVALALVPRLDEIDPRVCRILADFAPRSLLKRLLVDSLQSRGSPTGRPRVLSVDKWERVRPAGGKARLDETDITQAFSAGGLGRLVPEYEPRTPQVDMARQVARTFNEAGFLAVEAGTGTGKSLAYLVPAAIMALRSGTRVIVSTHTRNLQDQLATKDLPLVQTLVGTALRFTVLKGRGNYLCRCRYERLVRGQLGNLSPREREGLLPLIRWAEETDTGDIEEQRQFNRKWYAKVWNLISAEANGCAGQRCPVSDSCFVQRARLRAQGAHIVVINHALFYSDVCSDSPFLGATGPIVFDEAHHLEACGHRSLSVVLDSNRVNSYLETCTTMVVRLEKVQANETLSALAREMKRQLRTLRHAAEAFLSALDTWAVARQPGTAELQTVVEPHVLEALPQTGALGIALDGFQDSLLQGQRTLSAQERLESSFVTDVESCSTQTSQLRADFGYLCAAMTDDHVFWLEGNHERGWVKLCGVPLDIGGLLRTVWDRLEGGAVFTSATLSIADTMDYFTERIGLRPWHQDRLRSARFASPFSPDQALRVTLPSAPAPSAPEFPEYCAAVVAGLRARYRRNILVLFTANAMLREVERMLRGRPEMRDAVLCSQASGTSRGLLMQQFTASTGGVLLGTNSFWEGVDAPGSACEIVVIPRLPFAVPTEPLAQALAAKAEERYGESFFSYSVPEAVIRLRQGAGRLIRTASDRGVLVILDNRIVTKGYGRTFASSLGGELTTHPTVEALHGALDKFFGGRPQVRADADARGHGVERYEEPSE